MKRIRTNLYIAVFFLLLLIPLALTNNEDNYVSNIDNRKLVDFPDFDSSFVSGFETYMQDRIGLRAAMIRAYDFINDKAVHELTHPLYTYGKDGYIFLNQYDNIQYSDWHRQFAEMVLKMQNYCESRGSHFYFMFEPDKASVLREKLPEGEHYDDSWTEEMFAYMEELGINLVDNRSFLIQKGKEEEVFNKKYDAGHWNDLGCFYATNNLFRRIHQDIPQVTEMKKDEFLRSTITKKYLTNSQFTVNEKVPSFALTVPVNFYSEYYSKELETNRYFTNFWYMTTAEKYNSADYPEMLVFQGSYYNSWAQFIPTRASKYIAVHNYQNVMDLDYYYNLFFPDVVVFEVTQHTLNESYFDSGKMPLIDWNPSLLDSRQINDHSSGIAELIKAASPSHTDARLKLIQGKTIDKFFLDRPIDNIKYAYLITDKNIYDMRVKDGGVCIGACRHGEIQKNRLSALYYIDSRGKAFYSEISVKDAKLMSKITTSINVSYDSEENQYSLSTKVPGNHFYLVAMQIVDNENGEYLATPGMSSEPGPYKGVYINTYGKGRYIFRLKANSNLQDEYIDNTVRLDDTAVCYYEYGIRSISGKGVVIDNYRLYI